MPKVVPNDQTRDLTATCKECGRVFDLFDETDAEEWAFGHDCEDVPRETSEET
jgi:hypothetical protein